MKIEKPERHNLPQIELEEALLEWCVTDDGLFYTLRKEETEAPKQYLCQSRAEKLGLPLSPDKIWYKKSGNYYQALAVDEANQRDEWREYFMTDSQYLDFMVTQNQHLNNEMPLVFTTGVFVKRDQAEIAAIIYAIGEENTKKLLEAFGDENLPTDWLSRPMQSLNKKSPIEFAHEKGCKTLTPYVERLIQASNFGDKVAGFRRSKELDMILKTKHALFGIPLWIRQGWYPLLNRCLTELAPYRGDFDLVEVKEKYGEMRIIAQVHDHKKEVREILQRYRDLSLTVCDVCAEPGKERDGCVMRVRCDRHVDVVRETVDIDAVEKIKKEIE